MKFKIGDLIEGGIDKYRGRILAVEENAYKIFWISPVQSDQFKLYPAAIIDEFYSLVKQS